MPNILLKSGKNLPQTILPSLRSLFSDSLLGLLLDLMVRRRFEMLHILIHLLMGGICAFEATNLPSSNRF
jgi:hypothetical protein